MNPFEERITKPENINVTPIPSKVKAHTSLSLPERLGQKAKVSNQSYPVQALGDVLGGMAQALSEITQAPLGLCGQSVLMTGALVAQGFRNVEIDGRTIPVSLFALTIGESGERKTGVNNPAKSPIEAYEREQLDKYKQEFKEYKQKKESYDLAKANIKKLAAKETDPVKIEQALAKAGTPPRSPRRPTLLAGDPTIEGLIKHLNHSLPSIGVYTDEGAEFFGGHSMSSEKAQKTVAQYSKFWDGSAVDMMRASDDVGAFKLYGRRLSAHLMIQPVIANKVFSDPLMVQQGFIPRFLICYPESTMGTRMYSDESIREDRRYKKYFARIKSLLDKELQIDFEDGSLKLPPLEVTNQAKSFWISFHDEIESQLTRDGDLRHISGTAAKIAEQALRIAGVLTVINHENSKITIPEKEMKQGIELARYSLNQLLAMNEMALVSQEADDARKLLKWIAQNKYPYLYRNLDANKRPNAIRPKEAYELAVMELLEAGYIEHVGEMEIDGHKRKDVFKVIHYFEPED